MLRQRGPVGRDVCKNIFSINANYILRGPQRNNVGSCRAPLCGPRWLPRLSQLRPSSFLSPSLPYALPLSLSPPISLFLSTLSPPCSQLPHLYALLRRKHLPAKVKARGVALVAERLAPAVARGLKGRPAEGRLLQRGGAQAGQDDWGRALCQHHARHLSGERGGLDERAARVRGE